MATYRHSNLYTQVKIDIQVPGTGTDWTEEQWGVWYNVCNAADRLDRVFRPSPPKRAIKTKLGFAERDRTWVFTATNKMFRFHEGRWQCSQALYYGTKERSWFTWSSEPSSHNEHVFVEILSTDIETPEELAAFCEKAVADQQHLLATTGKIAAL